MPRISSNLYVRPGTYLAVSTLAEREGIKTVDAAERIVDFYAKHHQDIPQVSEPSCPSVWIGPIQCSDGIPPKGVKRVFRGGLGPGWRHGRREGAA